MGHGCMGDDDVHMCILPGLVMLDLGIGGGQDGVGEEVLGVVSCEMEIKENGCVQALFQREKGRWFGLKQIKWLMPLMVRLGEKKLNLFLRKTTATTTNCI